MEGLSLKQILFDLELGLKHAIKIEFRSTNEFIEYCMNELINEAEKYNFKNIDEFLKDINFVNNHHESYKYYQFKYLIFIREPDGTITIQGTYLSNYAEYMYIGGFFFRE